MMSELHKLYFMQVINELVYLSWNMLSYIFLCTSWAEQLYIQFSSR